MNPLLNIAINNLDNLKSGEVFLVKELFLGYEWNRLSAYERTNLGILFIDQVRNDPSLNVIRLPKTASNHTRYKRI